MQLARAAIYHMPKQVYRATRIEQDDSPAGTDRLGRSKNGGTYSGGLKKRLDLALGLLHPRDVAGIRRTLPWDWILTRR